MPDFTQKNDTISEPKELDAQEEMLLQIELQTQLLKSINNKLTFFVICAVLSFLVYLLF